MNDFESEVAEAHTAFLEAGHAWAQPRKPTETERLEAARLPVEGISAPKPASDQRTVRIRCIDRLAIRFASLERMAGRA